MAELAWVTVERQLGPPITEGTIALIYHQKTRETAQAVNALWALGLDLERKALVAQAHDRAVHLLEHRY